MKLAQSRELDDVQFLRRTARNHWAEIQRIPQMISRRVVLVLGAGASKPYGFPLASELLQQAVNGEQNLVSRLVDAGLSKPDIDSFIDELHRSQLPSVDAFLEYRPEFMEVGKATLAFYLMAYEKEKRLLNPSNSEHWYRYLYGQMKTIDFEDFG